MVFSLLSQQSIMIISDTFGGVCAAAAAVINQAVAEHWLLTSIFVVAAALQT